MSQVEIFKILNKELSKLQERNPQYSLRAFARKTGLQPSTLSRILSGKRAITKKVGSKILNSLCMDPEVSKKLTSELRGRNDSRSKKTPGSRVLKYIEMSSDQFRVLSDWYHFAIYSLAEISGTEMNSEYVAKKLGIAKTTAFQAIERMKRLGLLEQNADGKWCGISKPLTTSHDVTDMSIRKAHHQSIELAEGSLERDPVEERDFSFMTMAIDKDRLPEAKKKIREFRRELCSFLEGGIKKEVYRLNVQLFPVYGKSSKGKKDEKY